MLIVYSTRLTVVALESSNTLLLSVIAGLERTLLFPSHLTTLYHHSGEAFFLVLSIMQCQQLLRCNAIMSYVFLCRMTHTQTATSAQLV